MELSVQLFWDTNLKMLDYQKHARFIMERVFKYGSWKEVKTILSFYGDEKIKTETVQIREMDKKTLNFLSVLLNIPKQNFRCYTTDVSIRRHWNY